MPIGSDSFLGLHTEFRAETGEIKERFRFDGGELALAFNKKWSADILGRLGHRFGSFAPYVAAGVSIMQVKAKERVIYWPGILSDSETKVHIGGKFALGADFEITENVVTFTQVEYTIYNSRKYGAVKIEYDETAARVGVMYKF